MSREEKAALVDDLTSRLESAPFVALADYRGISVEQVNALRNKFREAGVHYEVIKNKLAKRAIAGSEKEAMNDLLVGMTAWIISGEDPIAAAKLLKAETKDLVKNEVFALKGGFKRLVVTWSLFSRTSSPSSPRTASETLFNLGPNFWAKNRIHF